MYSVLVLPSYALYCGRTMAKVLSRTQKKATIQTEAAAANNEFYVLSHDKPHIPPKLQKYSILCKLKILTGKIEKQATEWKDK